MDKESKSLLNSFRNFESAHQAEKDLGKLRMKLVEEEVRKLVCAHIEADRTGDENDIFDHSHLFVEHKK